VKVLRSLTAAAVAAATLTATASAASHHTEPIGRLARSTTLARQVTSLRRGIRWHRATTWNYQDRAGVRRTPTRYVERHTRSVPFLRWINHLWWKRQSLAWRKLSTGGLPWTTDWQTAVNIVQRDWPGTASWMLSCSGAEGGHGIWVWNGGAPYSSPNHGSGAGGWMQYMEGTFWGQFRPALALARAEHLALPPPQAASWTSALGQAFAAGWGYTHGRSAWAGDPYCR
jgi:hypothetical protein